MSRRRSPVKLLMMAPGWAIGLGALHISTTNTVSKVGKQVMNTLKVIALDFQQLILERTTGAAGGLEPAK